MVLIQGEGFRPNLVEQSVDNTIATFLDSLNHMSEEEFNKARESVLFDLNEFSLNLPRVAEKYFANMEEQILEESEQSYLELSRTVTQTSLYYFAKEFFVNKPRRITIELFAKQLQCVVHIQHVLCLLPIATLGVDQQFLHDETDWICNLNSRSLREGEWFTGFEHE